MADEQDAQDVQDAQDARGRLLARRYRLGSVLGRGGMGTVWRAEDEVLGRVVAVKELRLAASAEEDEKRRLVVRTLREAKATARIHHTGAVTVFDVVEEDERPWIVMELVESRSLGDVIKEDGPLGVERAAEIGLELLSVLGAAHRQGIVHRDVKPSNVLIGEEGRVVLTDFGIASVEGDPSVTSTGMLVGAPSYISPERAQGKKPGPPADLWSLGGTLYAMVEGRPPYDKGSAISTLTAVITEPFAPPKNAGPLRPVIEALLHKDPEKRMDEAGARRELRRVLDECRAEAARAAVAAAAAEEAQRSEATTRALPARSQGRSGGRDGARERVAGFFSSGARGAEAEAKAEAKAKEKQEPKGKAKSSAAAPAVPGPRVEAAGAAGAAGSAEAAAAAQSGPKEHPAPQAGGGSASTVGTTRAEPVADGGSGPASGLPWGLTQRGAVVVGALVMVLLVLIGTVLGVLVSNSGNKHGAAQVGSSSSPSQHGAGGGASASASAQPSGKTSGSASPSPSASTSASASASASGGVPAGFQTYTDAGHGFSVAVPNGFSQGGNLKTGGSGVVFTGPNSQFLEIDWDVAPGTGALQGLQQLASQSNSGFPFYQQLKLSPSTFKSNWDSADWEFNYSNDPVVKHALVRHFVVDKNHSFNITWITLQKDWNGAAAQQELNAFYSSFRTTS